MIKKPKLITQGGWPGLGVCSLLRSQTELSSGFNREPQAGSGIGRQISRGTRKLTETPSYKNKTKTHRP